MKYVVGGIAGLAAIYLTDTAALNMHYHPIFSSGMLIAATWLFVIAFGFLFGGKNGKD